MLRKAIILAGFALSAMWSGGPSMAEEKPTAALPKVVIGCPKTVVYGVGLIGGTQLLIDICLIQ